jgi:hypothetical protein
MTSPLMDQKSRRVTIDESTVQRESVSPERCTIKSVFTDSELASMPKNLKTAIERSEHNHVAKLHLAKLMKNGESTFLNSRQKFSR